MSGVRSMVRTLAEITPQLLEKYLASVRAAGQNEKSLRDKYVIVHGWLEWARLRRQWITNNPAEGLAPKKPAPRDVRFYLAKEALVILTKAEEIDARLAAIFALALYAGVLTQIARQLFTDESTLHDCAMAGSSLGRNLRGFDGKGASRHAHLPILETDGVDRGIRVRAEGRRKSRSGPRNRRCESHLSLLPAEAAFKRASLSRASSVSGLSSGISAGNGNPSSRSGTAAA
jgi:hypothetical protein